jgi:hypothetical protein
MRQLLLLVLALGLATPVWGAGDDTTLPSPVVETKSSVRWQISKLGVDRSGALGPGTVASVIVSGRDAGGDWVPGTDTQIQVTQQGSRLRGYAVDVAGVSQTCSVTLGQLFDLTATGYEINTKTLLTTCLGGS